LPMVSRPWKECGWFLGESRRARPPVAMGKVNHAYS
jgi:ribosomal protein L18E